MPKAYPQEFRQDVVRIARQGDHQAGSRPRSRSSSQPESPAISPTSSAPFDASRSPIKRPATKAGARHPNPVATLRPALRE